MFLGFQPTFEQRWISSIEIERERQAGAEEEGHKHPCWPKAERAGRRKQQSAENWSRKNELDCQPRFQTRRVDGPFARWARHGLDHSTPPTPFISLDL